MTTWVFITGFAAAASFLFRTSRQFRTMLTVVFVLVALLRYTPILCGVFTWCAAGGYLSYLAFCSLRMGEILVRDIGFRYKVVTRANAPVEFWMIWSIRFVAAIGLFVMAGWFATTNPIFHFTP